MSFRDPGMKVHSKLSAARISARDVPKIRFIAMHMPSTCRAASRSRPKPRPTGRKMSISIWFITVASGEVFQLPHAVLE